MEIEKQLDKNILNASLSMFGLSLYEAADPQGSGVSRPARLPGSSLITITSNWKQVEENCSP